LSFAFPALEFSQKKHEF